jgi:hypothetical protein
LDSFETNLKRKIARHFEKIIFSEIKLSDKIDENDPEIENLVDLIEDQRF